MKEYIKTLEEHNRILKEINELNNKLINTLKEKVLIQEQITLLLKERLNHEKRK